MDVHFQTEFEFTEQECDTSSAYFAHLGACSPSHTRAANAVIGCVRNLSFRFFTENYLTDEFLRLYTPRDTKTEAFFAVYGIGGYVTKSGARPDLDLLIATNLPLEKRAYHDDTEPFISQLRLTLSSEYEIMLRGEVPTDSNLHITNGRVSVHLSQRSSSASIDLKYAKSVHGKDSRYTFRSEEDFLVKDRTLPYGKEPKVLLYRVRAHLA